MSLSIMQYVLKAAIRDRLVVSMFILFDDIHNITTSIIGPTIIVFTLFLADYVTT